MSATHSTANEIAAATTRILISLQQDPRRELPDWPSVTMQQLRVMMILYAEGPTRVSMLANRLNVSTPTITGILDRLVRQNLTYRDDDPRDRRVVLNALTDHGRAVIEQIQAIDSAKLALAIETLSDEDQQAIVSALNTLAVAVDAVALPEDGR
jgi:DNA-binding MarR family transcriptional regulator